MAFGKVDKHRKQWYDFYTSILYLRGRFEMEFVKKNVFTIIVGIISICSLIICLFTAYPIPDKMTISSDEIVYNRRETVFEYYYNGDKPLHSNLLYAASDFETWTNNKTSEYTAIKKGSTIKIIVRDWDGKGTIYLYYGDKILAKY